MSPAELVERTLAHYRDKFAEHGTTPQGVDWNGPQSQLVHFEQLLRLLPDGARFSLNDLGCGYGALVELLVQRWGEVLYRGYDLSADMIRAAQQRFHGRSNVSFAVADQPLHEADFGIASGIFTLRLGRGDSECRDDMERSLDILDRTSRCGFGFNCLTSYSDPHKMKDYLYYPNPCDVFDLCKQRYGRNVALLHDYGLFAFTVLVRKGAVAAP